MKRISIQQMTRIACIAALYVAISAVVAPISFSAMQFRVAEALALLPILWVEAIPGVWLGCFFSNLFFGFGILDAVVGGMATLLAAAMTYALRKKNVWIAAMPPVVVNAVIIGAMLSIMENIPLVATMGSVGLGQVGACYLVGVPLISVMKKVDYRYSS